MFSLTSGQVESIVSRLKVLANKAAPTDNYMIKLEINAALLVMKSVSTLMTDNALGIMPQVYHISVSEYSGLVNLFSKTKGLL